MIPHTPSPYKVATQRSQPALWLCRSPVKTMLVLVLALVLALVLMLVWVVELAPMVVRVLVVVVVVVVVVTQPVSAQVVVSTPRPQHRALGAAWVLRGACVRGGQGPERR